MVYNGAMMQLEDPQGSLNQERKFRFYLESKNQITLFKRKGVPFDHVILKALAYALYWKEFDDIRLDPHLSLKFQPDLLAVDLAGEPSLWIQCGKADAAHLEYALKHTRAREVVLVTQGTDIDQIVHELRKKIHYRYSTSRLKVISFCLPLDEFVYDPLEIPKGCYKAFDF